MVIIEKDGCYLLVQEKKEIVRGLWNLPAGRAEAGEKIEETAVREVKEETGYSVKLIEKIGRWGAADAVKHVFVAEIVGGDLNLPINEIMDAKWFSFEDIKKMADKLRHKFILEVIDKYEQEFKKIT